MFKYGASNKDAPKIQNSGLTQIKKNEIGSRHSSLFSRLEDETLFNKSMSNAANAQSPIQENPSANSTVKLEKKNANGYTSSFAECMAKFSKIETPEYFQILCNI